MSEDVGHRAAGFVTHDDDGVEIEELINPGVAVDIAVAVTGPQHGPVSLISACVARRLCNGLCRTWLEPLCFGRRWQGPLFMGWLPRMFLAMSGNIMEDTHG